MRLLCLITWQLYINCVAITTDYCCGNDTDLQLLLST